MSPHPVQRGFTLFELLIVAALVAILVMFSVPMYRQWIQNAQLRARAESIAAGLQQARSEAVRLNATAGVRFVMSGNDWRVENVATGAVLQESSGTDLGKNAAVAADPSANATIVFGPLGLVTGGATVDYRVTHADAGGTDPTMKCVADGGEMRCLNIQVRGGGMVRMCDPNVSTDGDPRKCLP